MARGGVPLNAEERLRELQGRREFFTSNLSVNEFVLAADDGIRPLGQVMGSTVYHVGWQYTPMYQSSELTVLSHAQYHARLLALSRLQQEARLLGAHGVLGVRLERQAQAWGDNLLEWTARGTAIALDKGDVPALPFVCALSGQEFWTLRRAGYYPAGFAFGTCVYYHVASVLTQYATQGGPLGQGYAANTELTDYTQAVYTARHAAMSRMEDEARRVAAEGIVGVRIENDIRTQEVEGGSTTGGSGTRRDLIVQFTVLGTAVVPRRDRWPVLDYALPLTG
ncbi:MAG: heavy metal-binding domain-containing protein [Armatimonadetes bacterium]|nr:heavy metal-binding domain-containing protein [Armatimonadota bacterium]